MTTRQVAAIALSLLSAALLQAALAQRVHIGFARPDLLTVTLAGAALVTGGFGRSVAGGLWAGFLMASLFGGNFGSYMVSRCLAGAAVASIPKHVHRDSILLPIASVIGATLIAEAVYFVMAPLRPIGWWLKITLAQTGYNAVLAAPVHWLLRAIIGQPKDRLAFAPQRR